MISRREALKQIALGSGLGLTGAVIISTTSCAPTEAPAAERSISSMFDEWRSLHDRDASDETEAASEAFHERYCELQDAIIRSGPKTPRDLAMMVYADNGGSTTDHSDEFSDRLLAMALQEGTA